MNRLKSNLGFAWALTTSFAFAAVDAAAYSIEPLYAGGDSTLAAKESRTLLLERDPEIDRILEKFDGVRPRDKDLAVFQLDWVQTLKEAKKKAADEKRPVFLLVVTNSFGNLHTGHC
jgi:hypothetical protein